MQERKRRLDKNGGGRVIQEWWDKNTVQSLRKSYRPDKNPPESACNFYPTLTEIKHVPPMFL